jgi:hypothetical protein
VRREDFAGQLHTAARPRFLADERFLGEDLRVVDEGDALCGESPQDVADSASGIVLRIGLGGRERRTRQAQEQSRGGKLQP